MRNSFDVVREFEEKIADFCGARYAVATDCCTNAVFLSLIADTKKEKVIGIPAKTYISIPQAIHHAGCVPWLMNTNWSGMYVLQGSNVVDAAKRFYKHMYEHEMCFNKETCLSFHIKKHIPIGRGGVILTNNYNKYKLLRKLCYDGRDGKAYTDEVITEWGYHMYMTPEQAARGLLLLETMPKWNPEDLKEDYPDLRLHPIFTKGVHYD